MHNLLNDFCCVTCIIYVIWIVLMIMEKWWDGREGRKSQVVSCMYHATLWRIWQWPIENWNTLFYQLLLIQLGFLTWNFTVFVCGLYTGLSAITVSSVCVLLVEIYGDLDIGKIWSCDCLVPNIYFKWVERCT